MVDGFDQLGFVENADPKKIRNKLANHLLAKNNEDRSGIIAYNGFKPSQDKQRGNKKAKK
jgi:hypothetical protein